jgi:hypothetical protein
MSARRSSSSWLESNLSKLLNPPLGKERFRTRFQRSLLTCLDKEFSVEECFGLIWEETLETCALSDSEQLELYHELLEWAKSLRKSHLSATYSRGLFTDNSQEVSLTSFSEASPNVPLSPEGSER